MKLYGRDAAMVAPPVFDTKTIFSILVAPAFLGACGLMRWSNDDRQ